jgi:hypothetical protein
VEYHDRENSEKRIFFLVSEFSVDSFDADFTVIGSRQKLAPGPLRGVLVLDGDSGADFSLKPSQCHNNRK